MSHILMADRTNILLLDADFLILCYHRSGENLLRFLR